MDFSVNEVSTLIIIKMLEFDDVNNGLRLEREEHLEDGGWETRVDKKEVIC